jgi:hypothetical protein
MPKIRFDIVAPHIKLAREPGGCSRRRQDLAQLAPERHASILGQASANRLCDRLAT